MDTLNAETRLGTLLRRLLLTVFLACAAPTFADTPADATAVVIAQISDLRLDAAQASQQNLPILILFSSDYCRYCKVVSEEFLQPMQFSGAYANKILFRQIKLSARAEINDFDGRRIKVREFAGRYRVKLTPTLIFIDPQGRELAPPMVGVSTPDYYGSYLDEAINQAVQQLRAREQL